MKHISFGIFVGVLVLLSVVANTTAQEYTTWGLPEGAKARLGKGWISEIKYSPDGTRLAVTSSIGIWIYDARTGEALDLLIGHTGNVNRVSYSPDGGTLASGSEDDTIRLWDVNTGRHLRTLRGHTSSVLSLSYSPNGRTLASGGSDSTVRVWDVNTGEERRTLTGHMSVAYSLSYSPDGTTLASGSGDNTVRLWDVNTGEERRTLSGHTGVVLSLSYNPDGTTLASGSWDNTVRLWDVNTGEGRRTLSGHTGAVTNLSYSPDGGTLASGSGDGTILLWELAPTPPEPEPLRLAADVNADGQVDIRDLVAVATAFGETGETPADVNADGQVDIRDLVAVATAFGQTSASAPPASVSSRHRHLAPTRAEVKKWLAQAQALNLTDATTQRGIHFLQRLLLTLTPKATALFANYPNPFNPETWIPYQLAEPADVTVHIYGIQGGLVRTLALGHQDAGMYHGRSRAAYWDGTNEVGESVASGVYFYTLTAGDFTATRKLLIEK